MNPLQKTLKAIFMTIPILLGVVMLIGLLQTLVDSERLIAFFSGNTVADSFIGAFIGAVSAGNPITSYVLGGEMLEFGIGITAIAAFIVAWVTVGVVQLPAEMVMLGKRFAITRNILSFLSAVLIGVITYVILLVC